MALGLHCPRCGNTDTGEMHQEHEGPGLWCIACGDDGCDEDGPVYGPAIVDDCDYQCEHAWTDLDTHPDLDDLDEAMKPLAALFAEAPPEGLAR